MKEIQELQRSIALQSVLLDIIEVTHHIVFDQGSG